MPWAYQDISFAQFAHNTVNFGPILMEFFLRINYTSSFKESTWFKTHFDLFEI